ncbi:MAG: cytochrome c oxidase assembly protein [Proteobacteria bacterium]|nr:cytochrome c oxidase assembly protein [Pseudomonadota bacterium]
MNKIVHKTVYKTVLVAVLMFGFAFALVPLYDIICEITGLNGKTSGQVAEDVLATQVVDENRKVTVQFDASVNSELNWEFRPTEFEMVVTPGKLYKTAFYAKNLSDKDIAGRAIYSVTPRKASLYFNKTECFCFTEQILKAQEEVIMPVTFIIDSRLAKEVNLMTLSYTFFKLET